MALKGKKSIAIICPQYPPEKGAAPSRMAKLAAGLQARSIKVNVITALPNYPVGKIFLGYRGKLWQSELVDGVPVRRYWLYASNSSSATKRILNMITFSAMLFLGIPHLLRIRPETIIVNSPPLLVGLTGVVLSKIVRARVIANISDLWPLSALELSAIQKGFFYRVLERIEKTIYRHSDAISTQSFEAQKHIQDLVPDKNFFLYRNLDYTSAYIDKFPALYGDTPRILYAGLMGVAQGVSEICKQIDFRGIGVEFHLYGDGIEKAEIERYVSANPDCNIFLHDSVPKIQMPTILAQFHATIVPLKSPIKGAFPSKIYMAIAASLPVFFCGAGEGAQFVRESGVGWVSDPSDYQGLSDNIMKLASMTNSDYLALRERIKLVATQKYDLERQLDRFLDFIEGAE